MTVLGEDPGVEIVVSKYVADAGGTEYEWNTGLPNVIAAAAIGASAGTEHIDTVSGPKVTFGGVVNEEAVYLIATGW